MRFPYIGASYTARSKRVNAQRCVNLFPETGGPDGKSVVALYGTPGLRLWLNLAGGGVRGIYKFNADTLVAVVGANVYTVTAAGVATLHGQVDTGLSVVNMDSNGTVVFMATGGGAWVLNPATGDIAAVVGDDFTGADTVGFIDGYFVFNIPGTGRFQWSSIYSTNVDALDFATAEGSPDLLLSLLVDHREVWLFGEKTTEVFQTTANPDQIFQRINGAFIEQGCAAKFSPAKMDNTVFWLTADERGFGTVQKAVGYRAERVSTHALEFAIAAMPRIDDAIGFTYQQEGHSFYQLTFPTAQQTWVFDAASNLWHERAWRHPATGVNKRHRAQCQATFAGLTLVGDWENGNIYVYDMDTFTDNGDSIPRIRRAPVIADPNYRMQFHSRIYIDMDVGVGTNEYGQGYDPLMMMRYSDDGCNSWSNERRAPMGKIGENRVRVSFRRLGKSRERVYETEITDPVRVVLIGAAIEGTVGVA